MEKPLNFPVKIKENMEKCSKFCVAAFRMTKKKFQFLFSSLFPECARQTQPGAKQQDSDSYLF